MGLLGLSQTSFYWSFYYIMALVTYDPLEILKSNLGF